MGRYGLYEAVDFTPAHLGIGAKQAIVASYMAHHQGMVLLALADSLQGPKMVERFHAEEAIQSVEMLLQEQIPRHALLQFPNETEFSPQRATPQEPTVQPWRVPLETPMPLVHFLSNGRYSLLLTNGGGGYSRWGEIALTRWRADTTLDDWRGRLYIQELDDSPTSAPLWSMGDRSLASSADHQEVIFHPHMVELRRRGHEINVHMSITVAPDDDVEIRRVRLSNDSDRPRRLRLTTYDEVVLASPGADLRHPAFTKHFVESEYIPALNALLFRRRPRTAEESPVFLAHMLVIEEGQPEDGNPAIVQTSRAQFIGRGHSLARPAALANGANQPPLTGATLDPIMALGQTLMIPAHTTVRVAVVTLVAPSRAELLTLAGRYHTPSTIDRAFNRAHDAATAELRQLAIQDPLPAEFQRLLSLLIYPHAALRAPAATLAA
ncbi:MAG: hypothetical protein KDE31_31285, partial [Caldilineaceae bacterium]|nr:hypothetical protein [Caldilineaceae bacterium]